ncbi:IclR family transcriptional regulator [Phytoactinopolyspora mesophila]|uniref:Glycerol operon regulatory protein n=1 Tax=Phytoactinopolyspora mesophila TaxID=2650750 RepID=A0A7K3M2N1_9ACTN|nr:IclR family transcriptional regulator [Phytoactinopolyspora mesophila]NDL56688.1 helix-turn-helix domain-containing protein [Phytoactinopolyspora mesophila]
MKSLSRALMVLAELSRRGHPLTLNDIAGAVDLHKSTVHRMLATFVEHGLVRRDEANRYVVGLDAFDLARAARGETGPGELVQSVLETLCRSTGLTASYARPRSGAMTYAAVVGDATGFPNTEVIGTAVPMYATALGKAYLAHRPRVEVERYAARAPFRPLTPRTITDGYGLLRGLTRARHQGFAVEDREFATDLRAVSAPVLDHDGLAVAALSVTIPARPPRPGDVRRVVAAVISGASQLGAHLLDEAPAAPEPALDGACAQAIAGVASGHPLTAAAPARGA